MSFDEIYALISTQEFIFLVGTVCTCFVAFVITRLYVTPLLVKVLSRRGKKWRRVFEREKTFNQLAYLAAFLLFMSAVRYFPSIASGIDPVLEFLVAVSTTFLLGALIRTGIGLYDLSPISKDKPIKSFGQLATIILYLFGLIIAVCQLTGTDPSVFLGGAVAVMAAILLVFRDTLLSFIASMQLAANNLIRKGDWIEVKAYGADGEIIDIALHVVRVQNFDKTIVCIPTYKLMESGFRNWRGMFEAGARQIKRSILIDQNSIRFMSSGDVKRVYQNPHVKRHMPPLAALKIEHNIGKTASLTNLGMFRTYTTNYLKENDHIHKDMTLLVRHLEPTPDGIPLQLYAYTSDTKWDIYEGVQADIFEHIISLLPVFGLNLFQNPVHPDFASLDMESDVIMDGERDED